MPSSPFLNKAPSGDIAESFSNIGVPCNVNTLLSEPDFLPVLPEIVHSKTLFLTTKASTDGAKLLTLSLFHTTCFNASVNSAGRSCQYNIRFVYRSTVPNYDLQYVTTRTEIVEYALYFSLIQLKYLNFTCYQPLASPVKQGLRRRRRC